jgi:tetratricopeptide (TPR) repeat protein
MLLKTCTFIVFCSINFFIGLLGITPHQEPTTSNLKFDIYDVIYLEKNYGLKGSYRAKRKFNRIYKGVSANFTPKNEYTLDDAKYFFLLVANELKLNNVSPLNNYFITPELAEEHSYLDCDNFSLLYVSIASRLGLPVTPIYVKNHVFVRWYFDNGTYYNWDSRAGVHKADSYYVSAFNVSSHAKHTGIYLSAIPLENALAPLYVDFAIDKYENDDLSEALYFTNKALSVDSSFINAHFHKAKILEAKGDFEGAIRSYNQARSLDSLDTRYYYRKGALLIKEEYFTQAILILKKLLSFDNSELNAVPMLIDANLSLGNTDEARALYDNLYEVGVIEANPYILDARSIFRKHGMNID